MAEITAPIVTITLVLAAVFVPVAFIPGLTGRLYNQFAMTIVFSFLFSAINSLTFSPAMSRLFLRAKHGETKFFFFRWFNRGMRWLENSYDAFLDFTAHHWWTIVIPSLGLLALTYAMLVERPKAFIPSEDQGYLIAAIQTPDGTGREPDVSDRGRGQQDRAGDGGGQRRGLAGRLQRPELHQPDQLGHGLRDPQGMVASERSPSCERRRSSQKLQAALRSQVRGAVALVLQPPPIRGLSQTGGFEFMIEDRDGKGVEALGPGHRPVPRSRTQAPRARLACSRRSRRSVPQLRFLLDRTKAERLDVAVSDVFAVLQANLGGYYVNDFNLYGKVWKVMHPGRGEPTGPPRTTSGGCTCSTARGRRSRSTLAGRCGSTRSGPIDVPHYNMYNAAKITGQPAPGYSSGQAIAAMEEVADSVLPEGFSLRMDRHDVSGAEDRQRRRS